MKINSPAQLAARLDRSLAWRKKELTQYKLLAESSQSPQNAATLRRAGITLMYAHWEGFVKEASQLYLKFLARSPLDMGLLKSCFVAVMFRGEISQTGQAKRHSSHAKLIEQLRSIDTPPPKMRRITVWNAVSTRSNLKGDVLREIVATLALDYSPFELKETPIINHLVRLRNNIAHGGGLPVGTNDYGVLHTDIIVLMSEYKDQVQDAAYKDGHLR